MSNFKEDGSFWAWRYKGHGQLSDGTTVNRNTPSPNNGTVNRHRAI